MIDTGWKCASSSIGIKAGNLPNSCFVDSPVRLITFDNEYSSSYSTIGRLLALQKASAAVLLSHLESPVTCMFNRQMLLTSFVLCLLYEVRLKVD